MVKIGYSLLCEEQPPKDLINNARRAEEAGFSFITISDHYHPWIDQQGNAPFVWCVLGGISQVTNSIQVGIAVTCPTIRIHPAVVAQAAATAATMMPGRFFFGVGTGENLNEHILGDHWPPEEIRLEMLEEAVEIIRLLWEGKSTNYWGNYYTVENARIYTLPDELPPIYVSATGPMAAEVAGKIGDGYIGLAPQKELLEIFDQNAGAGKPHYAQFHVCWARDEKEAKRTAYKWWPIAGVPSLLHSDLPTPAHFEQASGVVSEEQATQKVVCGPDPEKYFSMIRKYIDAGYDHISFHQVGPDQEGFLRFCEREILPRFR